MIKTKFAAATAMLVLAAGSAQALTISAGEFQFILSNYDAGTTGYGVGAPVCSSVADCNVSPGITTAPGSAGSGYDTMGIFNIESIKNITTGTIVFQEGGADGYITGVFGQLSDYSVSRVVVPPILPSFLGFDLTSALSVGGVFAMYQNASQYNPALGPLDVGVNLVGTPGDPLSLLYPSITNTASSVFLSGVFTTGTVAGDLTTTYTSTFNSKTFAGGGQGFLDLTGGTAFNQFNTSALVDGNGNMRDMFLNVTFDDVTGAASRLGWTVTSVGQIKGNVFTVPEPSALTLSALALLAAGAAARRRKM